MGTKVNDADDLCKILPNGILIFTLQKSITRKFVLNSEFNLSCLKPFKTKPID